MVSTHTRLPTVSGTTAGGPPVIVINNQPSPDDEALRPKEEGDEMIIYIGDYVCRTAQIGYGWARHYSVDWAFGSESH